MAERAVARRYAKAFVELAKEAGAVDALGADLDRLLAALKGNDHVLLDTLTNPVFTLTERRAVLGAVLPGLGLNPLTANLVRLLQDKERIGVLPELVELYSEAADEHADRVRVTVDTAFALDSAMEDEVRHALARVTGKTVLLTTRVDPELIGGMVARVGDRVYDASVRTRLRSLEYRLLRGTTAAEA